MAISKAVPTYGMLNAWQDLCIEDIWRFNQVTGTGSITSECDVYVQSDREQIAQSLNTAWKRMVPHLGFFPRPVWTEETIRLGKGRPWPLQHLRTKYGYVEAFGQRATALIDGDVTVTYSDQDGDGVDETATMSVTTTVASDEIQVFFRTADGAPAAAHELWQIEPLTVSASGGTVTITGHRALFVDPASIWNVPFTDANRRTRNAATTSDANDFVTLVDVYRVYNDTTTPVQIIADPIFTQPTDLDSHILTTGVARLLDARLGTFEARIENYDCLRYAEAVKVYYKSGYPLSFGRIDNNGLLTALIRMANTFQVQKMCTFCDQTRNIWSHDRLPPGSEDNPVSQRLINNPFGTMAGQVYAWQTTLDYALGRGGVL